MNYRGRFIPNFKKSLKGKFHLQQKRTIIIPLVVASILLVLATLPGCSPETGTPAPLIETPPLEKVSTPSVAPEVVRDKVVAFLVTQYPADLAGKLERITWEKLPDLPVQALAMYAFRSDDWQMNMTVLPADLITYDGETLSEDTFDISLNYLSPPPFIRWTGFYGQNSGISEHSYVNRTGIIERIDPDRVRDQAYQFIIKEHPNAKITDEVVWSLIGSEETPGEIVNAYLASDIMVTVKWSEYSGVYSVSGYYEMVGDQFVEIEWNVTVSSDGSAITEEGYSYLGGE
jgi:hypothetical protein